MRMFTRLVGPDDLFCGGCIVGPSADRSSAVAQKTVRFIIPLPPGSGDGSLRAADRER